MKKFTLLLLPLALLACGESTSNTTREPIAQSVEAKSSDQPATTQPIRTQELTKDEKELVYNFCYALQATGQCKNLIMRLDTEPKIQKQLQVEDIRSPNSVFGDTCTQGITDAAQDKNACAVAWEKYSCAGSVTPRLIQESPFGSKNAILCEF